MPIPACSCNFHFVIEQIEKQKHPLHFDKCFRPKKRLANQLNERIQLVHAGKKMLAGTSLLPQFFPEKTFWLFQRAFSVLALPEQKLWELKKKSFLENVLKGSPCGIFSANRFNDFKNTIVFHSFSFSRKSRPITDNFLKSFSRSPV